MSVVIFIIIFLILCNRFWFNAVLESFQQEKTKVEILEDQELLNFIREKAGLKISKIKILDTNKVWAFMGGIPGFPYMVISKDAYENFSKDELEWLVLHESGHYVLWHNVKCIFLQALLIIVGLFLITNLSITNVISAVILGIIFPIIYIQIARKFEYEANDFAMSRMTNPKALTTIYDKAKIRWKKKGQGENSLTQRLFSIWTFKIYEDLIDKIKD